MYLKILLDPHNIRREAANRFWAFLLDQTWSDTYNRYILISKQVDEVSI